MFETLASCIQAWSCSSALLLVAAVASLDSPLAGLGSEGGAEQTADESPATREIRALIQEVQALAQPTDAEIEALRQRIDGAVESWAETEGEQQAVSELVYTWGLKLCNLPGRAEQAAAAYARAAAVHERHGNPVMGAHYLSEQAQVLIEILMRPEQGLEVLQRALEKVGGRDPVVAATITMLQGVGLSYLGRNEEAIEYLTLAESTLVDAGSFEVAASCAQIEAEILSRTRELDRAETCLRRAREYHEQVLRSEPADTADARPRFAAYLDTTLGEIAARQGNIRGSIEAFRRSEQGFLALGRRAEAIMPAVGIGRAELLRQNLVGALHALERAEAHHLATPDDPETRWGAIVDMSTGRAEVHLALGRTDEAWRALDGLAEIAARGKQLGIYAAYHAMRGKVLASLERLDEAQREFERAAGYARDYGDIWVQAEVAWETGRLAVQRGKLSVAVDHYRRATELLEPVPSSNLHGRIALDCAALEIERGAEDEALRSLDQAEAALLRLSDELALAELHALRGRLHQRHGRPAQALEEFVRMGTAFERVLATTSPRLDEKSSVSLRGTYSHALAESLRCLGALPPGDAQALASTYHIVQLFQGLGMAQAIAERGALEVPADLRSTWQAAKDRLRAAERQCAELWSAQPDAGERSAGAEMALAEKRSAAMDALHAAEHELERELDGVRLRSTSTMLRFPRAATLADVQNLLPASAALVEYCLAEDQAFAFVVTSAGARALDLGDPAAIERAAAALAPLLGGSSKAKKPLASEKVAALRGLAQLVLDPVFVVLPRAESAPGSPAGAVGGAATSKVRSLYIAPSGKLCGVPFEALLVRDCKPESAERTWPFLIAEQALAYVHSGTTMRELRRSVQERAELPAGSERLGFVALAHPDYRSGSEATSASGAAKPQGASRAQGASAGEAAFGRPLLDPLPNSGLEALEIAQLFAANAEERRSLEAAGKRVRAAGVLPPAGLGLVGGADFSVFLGQTANKERLLSDPAIRRAEILHLACHAAANPSAPQLAHLALSPGSDGGWLSLAELRDLDLSCALLALTGCETAAGPLAPLEGSSALSRAGLAAGADAVLATLWPVEDESMRKLVVAFYDNWLTQKRSRTDALAEAKRAAIRANRPISAWAASVLWDAP